MILLLDIGNSRIKWGTLKSGALSGGAAATHAAGMQQAIDGILERQPRPEAVWIANVGGAALGSAVADACRARWQLSARFAVPEREAFGVRNGYRDPERLGIDRWLAMLAARDRPGGSLCVVNCGTAVTLDLIDAAGTHHGGFVVPGVELMARSLATGTDAIRVSVDGPPADAPGLSTEECVVNGVCAAVAALVDRTLDRFPPGSARPVTCVISGGGAPAVLPLIRHAVVHDPDLVLRGLALLAGSR